MNTVEAIRGRRSIREFKNEAIPAELIDELIEAIRWAPSAGNLQSRKFYFVFDSATKKKLDSAIGNPTVVARIKRIVKKALGWKFISHAPLVVVGCCDLRITERYGSRGVLLYCIQDVAASVMSMMLAAHNSGLGSVWVGGFNEEKVSKALGLPGNLRPVAVIPVGFPARIPAPTSRLSGDDIVTIVGEGSGK